MKVLFCELLMYLVLQSCEINRNSLINNERHFIDVESEVKKVIDGTITISDLNFGVDWLFYLDTNYYHILSKYYEIDTVFTDRSDLHNLTKTDYDTLMHEKFTMSLQKAISKSSELKKYIEVDTDATYHLDMPVLLYKNKALLRANCTYYLIELIDSRTVGIEAVGWCYYD